jgi:hypothetical protein
MSDGFKPRMAQGEPDFKESMILNLRRSLSILESKMLQTQHLIALVEQSEEVVEFAKIMGEMQQQQQQQQPPK